MLLYPHCQNVFYPNLAITQKEAPPPTEFVSCTFN